MVVNEVRDPVPLPGDNPISDEGGDVFERKGVAIAFARQVLALDASDGAAVGVFGPWGSGKTSFVNLARGTFKRANVPVLDFNPWMFSGAEQLVERFFAELSAELKLRDLAEIGRALEEYGGALSGKVGAMAKIVGLRMRRGGGGTAGRRKKVACALRRRRKPIVVVLDDVDRLSAHEIREVIKLVRLTASFPNLIYIVSCDRLRVEQALDEKGQGLSGRDYLEKIIQWSFNLPEVPSHLLAQQFFKAINGALAGIESPGALDEEVWADIHREVLRPLIRNMRDVRRYAMAIRATVGELEGQVAQADVLALEAIRVFLPDVFRLLPGAIDGLTVMSQAVEKRLDRAMLREPDDPLSGFNKQLKAQVDGLIAAAEADRELGAARTAKDVVQAMIDHLFPVGARLRQMSDGDSSPCVNDDAAEHLSERRVAHEHVLRSYLERVASPELLAFHDAERALARMNDRDGLNKFVRSLEPTRWQDVVLNLCDLTGRFRPEHVEPGIVVLLNLWPDMPEQTSSSSVLGNDSRGTVRIATLRLLRVLEGASAVETAVRRILPELTSLSPKVELVLQVGHRENSGHKLVSETAANEFETMVRNEIRAASTNDLAEERDPSRVLVFAKHYGSPSEEQFDIDDSPKLTFALLRSVCGRMESGSVGNRVVHRFPVLDWERLIDLYGGEKALERRIDEMKARFEVLKPWIETRRISFDDAERLLELAEKYLSGWRPEAE